MHVSVRRDKTTSTRPRLRASCRHGPSGLRISGLAVGARIESWQIDGAPLYGRRIAGSRHACVQCSGVRCVQCGVDAIKLGGGIARWSCDGAHARAAHLGIRHRSRLKPAVKDLIDALEHSFAFFRSPQDRVYVPCLSRAPSF